MEKTREDDVQVFFNWGWKTWTRADKVFFGVRKSCGYFCVLPIRGSFLFIGEEEGKSRKSPKYVRVRWMKRVWRSLGP